MTASSCCCVELHCGVLRRVKLYQLEDGERWRDAGTGVVRLISSQCSCEGQHQQQQPCDDALSLLPASARRAELGCSRCSCPTLLLCVWSEDPEERLLLVHRVAADTEYGLQADTILSWSDAAGDWALSYQDRQRCDETLQAVHDNQQQHSAQHSQQPTASHTAADSPDDAAAAEDDSSSSGSASSSAGAADTQETEAPALSSSSALLPRPQRDTLESLQLTLQAACDDSTLRAGLVVWLTAAGGRAWLSSLSSLLLELERAGDAEGLQLLFRLMVALVNLHDESLLSLLLSEAQAFLTLCCLEYDPAVCSHLTDAGSRPLPLPLRRHTQALQAARCHRVPALQSAAAEGEEQAELREMERALHFHYLLCFVRDALQPQLSDAATAAFTSLLFLCRLSVLQRATEQPHLLHSLAASMASEAEAGAEPSCRCDRQRLSALPAARPSRSSFRSGLQLLSELLTLSRSLQPHVRSAFAQLLMEHRVVAILAQRLREAEDGSDSGQQTAAAARWCRWLVPAAVGVLSCLLAHCPDAFRAAYCHSAAQPAAAASSSVVQPLLSLLCRPELLDAASAGHILAFLRLLADAEAEPDTDDEDGAQPAAWRELERCLLQEQAMQARLPAALAAFAGHDRPQRVRIAAVALLDWLSFCTARLGAATSPLVPVFLTRHRLVAACSAFLAQQRQRPSAPAEPAVPLHCSDVLLAAVRFLSAVVTLRLPSLLQAMVEAGSFRLLLALLLSPLQRDNMLSAAVLQLLSSLARTAQQQSPMQPEAELDERQGEDAALLLPVIEHVVGLQPEAAGCSPSRVSRLC